MLRFTTSYVVSVYLVTYLCDDYSRVAPIKAMALWTQTFLWRIDVMIKKSRADLAPRLVLADKRIRGNAGASPRIYSKWIRGGYENLA